MRVLERNAEITTRYGGGFVQSIDGVEGELARRRSLDWFFYVNGVESTGRRRRLRRCTAARRSGGTTATGRRRCTSRPWSAPGRSPSSAATTGSATRCVVECLGGGVSLRDGDAERCAGAGRDARRPATPDERDPGPGRPLGAAASRTRRRRRSSAAPQESGVFADFERGRRAATGLVGARLKSGDAGQRASAPSAGPRRRHPPLRSAARLGRDRGDARRGARPPRTCSTRADLRDHYAVAIEGREETPLPLGA